MTRTSLLYALCLLSAGPAAAAAWTSPEGELVVSQTSLLDLYDNYMRHSGNTRPLEEAQGSVVQVGPVRRYGFFLQGEYGLTERVTFNIGAAYFLTHHLALGPNVEALTNASPNQQYGLQDLVTSLRYLAYQHIGPTSIGFGPYVGFALPLQRYDTTVNNPIGDGIMSFDFALAVSLAFPDSGLFFNADAIYRVREKKKLRAGQIYDQLQGVVEMGYFITPRFSIRALTRYYESLGGVKLTFDDLPVLAAQGVDAMQLYENPLVYDQDALFVGGGPYLQISDSFGIGATYLQAVWFRNHANLKTLSVSLSWNPQITERAQESPLGEEGEVPAEETPPPPTDAAPTETSP